uniref:Rab-GAP TBC domain-containing protein n=1 Tax=Globisporangium ultimum (strain ATCC 200006 / CBS 805.95 / DAOM BR144) TaxID=431595 RepID=K3X4E0_GLOUD
MAQSAASAERLNALAIAAFCQYCEVAFHQFRPRYTCNVCFVQVCQFCAWHSGATRATCLLCQPELKADQPSFSLRQFLWTVKLLPFACRAEKWFCYARKRRSRICFSSMTKENYHELLQELGLTNRNAGSAQQLMIDQDVDRTFHQLHDVILESCNTAFRSPTRNAFKKKAPLSEAAFAAWKESTQELLSAFLLLKPQIGYCQGMTHLVAVLAQESKLNREIAFRLFLCMTETYRMDFLYGPEMRDVNLRFFQLDESLRRYIPNLHTHMSDLGVHPTTYASSWILTLFTDCRVLPHCGVLLFLDLFFRTGWKAFYRVAILIFNVAKEEIMRKQTAADILIVVTKKLPLLIQRACGNDIHKFVALAASFKLRNSFLDALEMDFWTQRMTS